MAHRRGSRVVTQKRLTSWFFFDVVATTQAGAGSAIVYSLNAPALLLRPFTVVRTRFEFQLRSDQSAAIEFQEAAYGFAVVSDQAVGVGVTAVPTPLTDMGSDLWFLHKIIFGDESALTDRTRSSTRVTVDSKAMRKVDIGQDIVGVMESAGGLILTTAGRMLVKVN